MPSVSLNFYSSLHVKVFFPPPPPPPPTLLRISKKPPGQEDIVLPLSSKRMPRPLCFTPTPFTAYINITLWHASTSRRPLIGRLQSVNHYFFLNQVMWVEEGRGRVVQFTGRCLSTESRSARRAGERGEEAVCRPQ